MEGHEDSEHLKFWRNLMEGRDWFQEHRRPPDVAVADGRYRFEPDRWPSLVGVSYVASISFH